MQDDFAQAVPIAPGFSFVYVKRPDAARLSPIAQANICFCIDEELVYEPFFADFGPLNLGKSYRFCMKTNALMQEAQRTGKHLYFYTGPHAHFKANAAVLVGVYQVIFLNRSADEAYKPLANYKPYVPFRDPSCGVSTFHLTVHDCLKGIQKARDVGFITWNSGHTTWSLEEYEHYEQVENGDLNWIVPNKFVAFSGPAARGNEIAGYRLHTPEDYWDYFRKKNVTTVIRLNKKVYDRKRFLDGGLKHHELYFPDGSCPSDAILQRFLDIVENEPACIAVHCKAGLGRTGVLICCYMMKHFRFTAEEVIGYIRICRPGSVIGPQQNYLREMEGRMWHEGDVYRAQRNIKTPAVAADLVVAGRATGDNSGAANGYGQHNSMANPYGLSAGSVSAARTRSASSTPAQQRTPSAAPADMSLMQYSHSYQTTPSSAASSQAGSAGSYVPSSAPASASSLAGGGLSSVSSFTSQLSYGSSQSSQASASSAAARARYGAGRSITPLRYGLSGSAGGAAPPPLPSPSIVSTYGVSSSHPGPLGARSSSGAGAYGSASNGVSRSMPSMPMGGRAPSADRGASRGFGSGGGAPPSSAALRATLHTDTLASADRPRTLPERNTQSADISSGSGSLSGGGAAPSNWKISTPAGRVSNNGRSPSASRSFGGAVGSTSAKQMAAAGPATSNVGSVTGGVARVLAPNGQPRKVPVALLSQYQAANNMGKAAELVAPVGGRAPSAHLRSYSRQ